MIEPTDVSLEVDNTPIAAVTGYVEIRVPYYCLADRDILVHEIVRETTYTVDSVEQYEIWTARGIAYTDGGIYLNILFSSTIKEQLLKDGNTWEETTWGPTGWHKWVRLLQWRYHNSFIKERFGTELRWLHNKWKALCTNDEDK